MGLGAGSHSAYDGSEILALALPTNVNVKASCHANALMLTKTGI